jgi:hypothetical protein
VNFQALPVFLGLLIYNGVRLHPVVGRIAMRLILALLTSVGLAASVQTAAAQAQPASSNPMVSPIVCETPQLEALSKQVKRQLHVKLCVQTDILVNLNSTGASLATAVHAYAPFPEANGSTTDPGGITCRRPWNGRLECAFNSFWSTREANVRSRAFLKGSNPDPLAWSLAGHNQ